MYNLLGFVPKQHANMDITAAKNKLDINHQQKNID